MFSTVENWWSLVHINNIKMILLLTKMEQSTLDFGADVTNMDVR